MKKIIIAFIGVILLISQTAEARKKPIEVVGGTIIPGYGLAIDASYDKRLDDFVPGYKVLNVAIVNQSFNIVEMNPSKDKWWIQGTSKRKKYRLITDLRSEDPEAWHKVPMRARGLIGYPLVLPIGARQVIDLFVPDDVPVENFNKIIVKINSLGVTFKILSRQ